MSSHRVALPLACSLAVSFLPACGRWGYDEAPSADAGVDASLDVGAVDAPLDASRDASVDAPRGPLSCPAGAIVCDSFDLDVDAGWTASGSGTLVRDSVGAFSPPSLHGTSALDEGRRFSFGLPPTSARDGLWARAMVRVSESPAAGFVVVFELGSNLSMLKVSFDFVPEGMSVYVPGDRELYPAFPASTGDWVCVELFVRDLVGPADDEATLSVTLGDIVDSRTAAPFRFEAIDAATSIDRLRIGPTTSMTASDVMIDDVYVGPARAGCSE